MKLSKIILFMIGIVTAVTLTGCSEKLIDLSSSEQNAIVSYSAHTVTLYNTNQEMGYVKLSEEYLKKLKETKPDIKPEVDGTGNEPAKDDPNKGKPTEEALNVTQAMGISNLNVDYIGMELSSGIAGVNGEYQLTPDDGKKLLSINFRMMNQSNEPIVLNMLQQNDILAIKINNTKVVSSMITILPIDMGTLETTLGAGEMQEVYLFFQVSNQTQEEIEAIDFIVQRDGKDYMVKVK